MCLLISEFHHSLYIYFISVNNFRSFLHIQPGGEVPNLAGSIKEGVKPNNFLKLNDPNLKTKVLDFANEM